MSQVNKILFSIIALALIGGVVFLMTAELDPPARPVSKTLDNDRFPR